MAIIPVIPSDIEFFTTVINPKRYYSSGSLGITGSLSIFARSSHIEKETNSLVNFQSSFINDSNIENFRNSIVLVARNTAINGSFLTNMQSYMSAVHKQSISARKQAKTDIRRFTPGVKFTSNTIKKLNVKDILMSYYRVSYPTAQWSYTNYNSYNFFTSPTNNTTSVLLYPNISNDILPEQVGHVSGTYSLSGAFSFDFHINPRYKQLDENSNFKAGTIFHLSSSYALSLITGSKKDENGLPTAFRLQLQLSHSADIAPSQAQFGSYPNNLVFLSDDNCLNWNNWHHVIVRWGTNITNEGTGSFNIDGLDCGTFVVPSGTINPVSPFSTPHEDPHALCVGNFYEGANSALDSQTYFFSANSSLREGVVSLNNDTAQDSPANYTFDHPLNAEVHDLIIRRHYLTDFEISQNVNVGISKIDPLKIAFFSPPFFIESTAVRRSVNGLGGILQTPFFEIDGSTDDPFNVAMSFGVNGHYINLENFVKDFANDVFPLLHHMTGCALDYTTSALEANEFLYKDPGIRRRNLLIMPCDDGKFFPNYELLKGKINNKSVDVFGRVNKSVINLDNLLNMSSLLFGATYDDDYDSSLVDNQIGYSPELSSGEPGDAIKNKKKEIENIIANDENNYSPGTSKDIPLTIYQRTKDASSNQVTFFDISNLYYGSRIIPGSFQLCDNSLTGSEGRISITLKDDGNGNLYRADSLTPLCTWNSVGNIFYNEGIVVIKSPHLYFFGKEQYEMSFSGEHQMHTQKYEILAGSGLLNSSSNPSYANVQNMISASKDPLDTDKFVYISSINLHDENLNVVAKAILAQPVIKREGEKVLFKIAFDF